jgi:hypothetical protein
LTELQKVTDPAKMVTDHVLLSALEKQGIDKNYVEFYHDYAPAYVNGKKVKGQSPYAKFYRDLKSKKRFMVVSQLPMVDADGSKVEVGWEQSGDKFTGKNNLFKCTVKGTEVELKIKNDQPDGRRTGDKLTFSPQLFLDGVEQKASESVLLNVDPVNANYSSNVLEWDYGICKRWLRLIEGRILGSWVFESNPLSEVRIKYNQSGDWKLRLGQYKSGEDEELIPINVFAEAEYPFTVCDSDTFYPDADPESSTVDGTIWKTDSDWSTAHGASVGSNKSDSVASQIAATAGLTSGIYYIYRAAYLFDTSGLPDGAVISAATLSIYGSSTYGSGTHTYNIYSSNPASNTALVSDDFDQFGTTAFCDSAIAHADWDTSDYNDFALNSSGIAAISKTGVSKFGMREAAHDVANSAPTADAYIQGYYAEQGEGYKPKLVVTYTTGEAKNSADTGSGVESLSSRLLGVAEAGAALEAASFVTELLSGDGGVGSEVGGLLKGLFSSDAGTGADAFKALIGKAGSDMRLTGRQGQVGIPNKEVSI